MAHLDSAPSASPIQMLLSRNAASWDFESRVREISYQQIELVASKVSVLNGCFY